MTLIVRSGSRLPPEGDHPGPRDCRLRARSDFSAHRERTHSERAPGSAFSGTGRACAVHGSELCRPRSGGEHAETKVSVGIHTIEWDLTRSIALPYCSTSLPPL